MNCAYTIYGLRLAANSPIPGLAHTPDSHGPDTEVWLQKPRLLGQLEGRSEPWGLDRGDASESQPTLMLWRSLDGNWLRLLYSDGTEFTIQWDGTALWATWPDPLTLEDASMYLLGPVLGLVLRLKGVTSLHASAVAIGGHAVAILGRAGAGKSTTAAALARLGYPVVSEDVLALTDLGRRFIVRPGYPTLRLWPAAVKMLFRSPDALPQLTANWDKRRLDLAEHGYHFQSEPLPLAAIYLLGDRLSDATAPLITAVSPRESLMALIGNTYGSYLTDARMRARDFDVLSRLAATVPVRQINPHRDPSYLPQLCDAIVDDFRTTHAVAVNCAHV
jgi:hypothetical protein